MSASIAAHDGKPVCHHLPLHPRRPHEVSWQVHTPSTETPFSLDGLLDLTPYRKALIMTDVAQPVVLHTAEHVHEVLIQQSAKHAKASIRQDALVVVLDLADFVFWM